MYVNARPSFNDPLQINRQPIKGLSGELFWEMEEICDDKSTKLSNLSSFIALKAEPRA